MPRNLLCSVATTVVASLVLSAAAPCARADDAPDAGNAILKPVTADAPWRGVVLEKLSSAQDQPLLELPIITYEQPTWAPLCVMPCRANLDLNGVYRVGPENGVTTSESFTLPTDVAALHVDPGSSAVHKWARVFIIAGILAAVSGATTVLATSDTSGQRVGYAVGGAGLLGVAIGIPMLLLSNTHVQFN